VADALGLEYGNNDENLLQIPGLSFTTSPCMMNIYTQFNQGQKELMHRWTRSPLIVTLLQSNMKTCSIRKLKYGFKGKRLHKMLQNLRSTGLTLVVMNNFGTHCVAELNMQQRDCCIASTLQYTSRGFPTCPRPTNLSLVASVMLSAERLNNALL
jgi:hypothetical protein